MFDYGYSELNRKLNTSDGQRFYNAVKQQYESAYSGSPIMALDYSKFKLIYETGNRSEYEDCYFDRRKRLALLEVLAIGDATYLTALENVLASICDEYSWVLPAHSYVSDGKFDYSFIDLFEAETCFYLSEIVAVFGDRLSFDIRARIKSSLKSKIVDNFESRTFWYEREQGTNWTAVCAGSIGIMYLYIFPERFDKLKDRFFALCEDYLRGIHDDGVCEEGADYWIYGFSWLVFFADIYLQLKGEVPEFMRSEKVKRTLDYHSNSIVNGRFLPFADVISDPVTKHPISELVIKKLFPDEYRLPDFDFYGETVLSREAIGIRVIDSIGRFSKEETANSDVELSKYYPDSQIFVRKNADYAFLTKGGHNQEMHNHNDVGAFSLYVGSERIVADFGKGKYTLGYFNDKERYGDEVFVCGSQSHSVPIIDGKYQLHGKNRSARLISQNKDSIEFDISEAYDIADGTLTVSYICEKDRLKVKYGYKGDNKSLTFRFVSDHKPEIRDGRVFIRNVEIVTDGKYKISIKEKEYDTYSGIHIAYILDYELEPQEETDKEFDFLILR